MRTLIAHFTILIALVVALAQGEIIASFIKPTPPADKGTLNIYFDRMKSWPTAHEPIYPVVVSGNQGAGKSTLLNALSQALDIQGNMFKSDNSFHHCTVDVEMGHSSSTGITPVDQPGQQKSNLRDGLNLHSANVDFMLAQTVSPFANILLHVCESSILDSDLEMMSLYSDQRMHTGQLSAQQSGAQPHLVIAIRTSRVLSTSEEEYLQQTIPASHPLRKTFKSIHLVRMPVVSEEDEELLTNENFHPERIPKYWAAVQSLKTMITDLAAQVPASARWTAAEIATVLEKNLPQIRASALLDIPTARSALMLNKVQAALAAATPALVQQFDGHVRDPFHADHVDLLPALTAARATSEKALLAAFVGHETETALWLQIKTAVTASLDQSTTGVVAAVEKQKGVVLKREQDAYETAATALSKTRTDLRLDGVPSTVDQTLVTALRAPIAAFQQAAVVQGVTPSPGYADKLQRLKNDAVTQVKAAHDANSAVHTNTRHTLKAKPIPAKNAFVVDHVHSCYNHGVYRSYDLSAKFPEYFSAENRGNILSVNSRFHGTGDRTDNDFWRAVFAKAGKEFKESTVNTGSFNLGSGVGRHLVSTAGERGRKYKYNEVFYNPDTTQLEVNMPLGGWSGGKDTNCVEMHDVTLSITCNALMLPENAVFKQDYARAAVPPVF